MKYIKTNEAIFSDSNLKKFDEIIKDFESNLTNNGFRFTKNDKPLRPKDSILKQAGYTITNPKKPEITYNSLFSLTKQAGILAKTHINYSVKLSIGDIEESREFNDFFDQDFFRTTKKPFELLQIIAKNFEDKYKKSVEFRYFFEEFPSEEIESLLLELKDEFGLEFKISQSKPEERKIFSPPPDSIPHWMIQSDSFFPKQYEFGLSKARTRRLGVFFSMLDELYRTFDSRGLTLRFDLLRLVKEGKLLMTVKEKKVDK